MVLFTVDKFESSSGECEYDTKILFQITEDGEPLSGSTAFSSKIKRNDFANYLRNIADTIDGYAKYIQKE